MAQKFLDGIFLENFRAIGERSFIGPFQPINFFVGPNNAGKSTVLLFLARHLHGAATTDQWRRKWEFLDVHIGKTEHQISFGVGMPADGFVEKVLELTNGTMSVQARTLNSVLNDGKGMLWFQPDHTYRQLNIVHDPNDLDELRHEDWHSFFRQITGGSGGGNIEQWKKFTMQRIGNAYPATYPPVHIIPAIREVSAAGDEFKDYSGKGLIDKLAELQHPAHGQIHLRQEFEKINLFLQTVTECEDARIEIPHNKEAILVNMNGRVLPLSSLGTGIHEVVMIASFCTLLDKQIVCVEEPEIHLHPLLQRRLIRYLNEKTSNQYFIATHSASIIDAVPASIFNVESVNGQTTIQLCVTPGERHEICKVLGYRASDLLQCNAIIWVEGPSDRIYINHWIKAVDSSLVEGIDYAIMFYGGRMLSHLSPDDPEISDFISLRKLNRHVAVVIDSDKKTAHTPINPTKERVKKSLGDSFAWVTKGREIENYLSPQVLQTALAALFPKFQRVIGVGQFDHRLPYIKKGGEEVPKPDKVKIAKEVVKQPADLSQLDLAERMNALVEFIRGAGHPK